MTNAEFYKKEIREVYKPFGFNISSKEISSCLDVGCNSCLFYRHNQECFNNKIEWLLKEHEELLTLEEKEYIEECIKFYLNKHKDIVKNIIGGTFLISTYYPCYSEQKGISDIYIQLFDENDKVYPLIRVNLNLEGKFKKIERDKRYAFDKIGIEV